MLLVSVSAMAQTEILVFENLENPLKADDLSFSKDPFRKSLVIATADNDYYCDSDPDSDCTDIYQEVLDKRFSRVKRDVYFTKENGEKVYCGKTSAFFKPSVLSNNCEFEVRTVSVCYQWHTPNDCTAAYKKYQGYIIIK